MLRAYIFFAVAQTVSCENRGAGMRRTVSYALKWAVVITALGGVLLGFFTARADGYSHWSKRMLYFTTQSNIWIGVTMLFLALQPFIPLGEKDLKRLYFFKYLFTVSIVMTGLVFCLLLAPFARDYPAWTPFSFCVHAFSPAFSLVDFFVDETPIDFKKNAFLWTVLPPVAYFAFASVLSLLGVDFGRGEPYPYFFVYLRSPAGLFGFSSQFPFFMGSLYWYALLSLVLLAIGKLLLRGKSRHQRALSTAKA